jgi:tetratricopeptide (TPR) repeat protein
MERVYAPTIDAHASALAHHLYQAGTSVDREKTIHFLSQAATEASKAAAHEEALDHLENAISLLDDERSVHLADLHARRAGALGSLWRNRDAVQEYERALALYDALGEHLRFIETCAPLAIFLLRTGQLPDARAVVDRAARHAKDAPPSMRCGLLALEANTAATVGEIDRALELFDELHKSSENELPPRVIGLVTEQEMYTRYDAGQLDLCEAAARKASRIFEPVGDVWSLADIAIGVYSPPLLSGRPVEAERLIHENIRRATQVGHDVAKFAALAALPLAYLAKGDLQGAERAAREALAFGESSHCGWLFMAETSLGGILLYRAQTEEGLSLLTKAVRGPTTHFSGFPQGLLALGMTVAEKDGAANAFTAAMRFLPRPGTSRGTGAWHAVLGLTEALCLCGRREEAGRLQLEAEKIAAEWDCNMVGFPVLTAAGIAAACACNWTRAEAHHLASIARMEGVPYVTAQPIARYWYADMLAERGGPGDIEKAKALLQASITASDAIGLVLYARLARRRFDTIRVREFPKKD